MSCCGQTLSKQDASTRTGMTRSSWATAESTVKSAMMFYQIIASRRGGSLGKTEDSRRQISEHPKRAPPRLGMDDMHERKVG